MQFQTTVVTVGKDWKLLSYEIGNPVLVQSDAKNVELFIGVPAPTERERGFTVEQWETDKLVGQLYGRAKMENGYVIGKKGISVEVVCFRPISHMNAPSQLSTPLPGGFTTY